MSGAWPRTCREGGRFARACGSVDRGRSCAACYARVRCPEHPRLQSQAASTTSPSRGNRRQAIFADCRRSPASSASSTGYASSRGWLGHAYCLMPNHYHLVLETPEPDLSHRDASAERRLRAGVQPSSRGTTGICSRGGSTRCWSRATGICSSSSRYLALNPVARRPLHGSAASGHGAATGHVAGFGRAPARSSRSTEYSACSDATSDPRRRDVPIVRQRRRRAVRRPDPSGHGRGLAPGHGRASRFRRRPGSARRAGGRGGRPGGRRR